MKEVGLKHAAFHLNMNLMHAWNYVESSGCLTVSLKRRLTQSEGIFEGNFSLQSLCSAT